MGRINVTIRIFEGALAPNVSIQKIKCQTLSSCVSSHLTHAVRALSFGQKARLQVKQRIAALLHRKAPQTHLFVTVLAQDHCYSDLLRFVPTINSRFRSAMTNQHCPSA